ncbi:MAG: RNA polymerase sigma factor [Clostridium sp.]
MISDKNLIEIIQSNKKQGIEVIMDEYSSLVYTIVNNLLSSCYSKEDIEDCISNIFVDIYKSLNNLQESKGSIKGYISLIARRRAIDMYRKYCKKNKQEISLDMLYEEPSSYECDVSTYISEKEESSFLAESINALGEPDRTIIIRKYFLYQSSKDISKILDIKVNTIDKRASRALIKLKNMLGGKLYG